MNDRNCLWKVSATMKVLKNWNLPDLKEAGKRTRGAVERVDSFMIPASAVNMGEGKTYWLSTYGCQANERDSETLAGILETLGYQPAQGPESADVILVNTCAIRENAMDKVLGELGSFKRIYSQRPDVIIGVAGCMAQEDEFVKRVLAHYPWVRLLFGTHNIQDLPSLLVETMDTDDRVVHIYSRQGEVYENLPVRRFGKHKAWVNIMYGCDKFCTYCIVPYTRGKQRSRTMEDILKEIRELKAAGYREVTLLGQNVNAYGKDLDQDLTFASLLEETARTGIDRIRFMTSHPWDFTQEMIDVIARYDNIMPYIHLPLQSGDTDVLRRMGRRYTAEEYKALYDSITARIPGVAVSTDIIVGFPDESDEAFAHTLEMVKACRFDSAFTFIYSPRPGTPAARMEDPVSPQVKKDRLQLLNQVWNEYALEKMKAYEGKTVQVLVDGPSKRNPAVLSGYTETNKLVNFTGEGVKAGDIVPVFIETAKTFSLDGHLVTDTPAD